MTITLDSTELCKGQTRNADGDAVGPRNLRVQLAPGVAVREFAGADRVQPEHVRSDSGTVSFGVTRTFGSVEAALGYIAGTFIGEASEGQLKFGDTDVFGENHKSAVTQRVAALVGRTVAVEYTITGVV